MARENVIERALSGRTIGGSGCDQIPGLKGKTGVSQQQLLLALDVMIKPGLGHADCLSEISHGSAGIAPLNHEAGRCSKDFFIARLTFGCRHQFGLGKRIHD